MWTDTDEGRKFIGEISSSVVNQVAPEEQDLFDELLAEYFHDPTPPGATAHETDEPLGFGLSETMVAVTPAAAAMANAVFGYLVAGSIIAAQEQSIEVVKKRIKVLFDARKKGDEQAVKESETTKPLTRDQLEQVRNLARSRALEFGIDPETAEKMSYALIGSLALVK